MSGEVLRADVVVIGAGMAGASVAAELSRDHSVIVLEREEFPGYHATGRSAALFSQTYGGALVRALTRASRDFCFSPPDGFAASALVRPRGVMFFADETQRAALEAFAAEADIASATRPLTRAEALARAPILKPEAVDTAIIEDGAVDIDVDLLHQGYLRQLKAGGGRVLTSQDVVTIAHIDGEWRVETGAAVYQAPLLVNAAGAWADEVAALAGAPKLGLAPKKRTAVLVDAPAGMNASDWPMTMDVGEHFYFKPDAGRLLLSPADETPSPACDVYADDMDVAITVDRVQQFANLDVRRVVRSWAGLRTFSADRAPVVGFASGAPRFFWLAAQGGFGIQTAPALCRVAAALIRGETIPGDIAAHGVTAEALSPARFTSGA